MNIGIDLGTCNTVTASLSRDGQPILIMDATSKEAHTPSLVMIDDKMALVGNIAEQYKDLYPDKNLIRFYKRCFGTQQPVFFDKNGKPWFSETVAAMMLKKVRFDAEMVLPDTADSVVITVPAHYNDAQRKSVLEAASLADINLTALIEEPVAAALSYMNANRYDDEIIMVYDFGGGTFDLTLITRNGNSVHVLAKDGLSNLGGKEFDEIISNRIIEDYQKCFHIDISHDMHAMNTLGRISENIKVQLSKDPSKWCRKWISLSSHAFEFTFNINEFEKKSDELIKNTQRVVDRCLRSVGITFADVNKIVMVGGTSQIPFIKSYWLNKINHDKQELIYHDPFTSVAYGAALYAGRVSQSSGVKMPLELKTVSTYTIAIVSKTDGNSLDVLLFKNSPLPISAKRIFTIRPNETLKLSLVQYWDENEQFKLGKIKIGPFQNIENWNVELLLENRSNGTIAVKTKNIANNKDLKFEFEKEPTQYEYNADEQKKLLNSVTINTIF